MNHDDWMDAVMYALKAQTAPAPTFHNMDCGEVGGGMPHPASAHDKPDQAGQCMDDPSYDPVPPELEPFTGDNGITALSVLTDLSKAYTNMIVTVTN